MLSEQTAESSRRNHKPYASHATRQAKRQILPLIAILSIVALSATAYPLHEKDEMTIAKLKSKIFQYKGKVVGIQMTYSYNMERLSTMESRIYCYFYSEGNEEPGEWPRSEFYSGLRFNGVF